MTTHAERMAERAARIEALSRPAPAQPRVEQKRRESTGRVLHYLTRAGEARCNVPTPTPFRIAGNEQECPACARWYGGLRRGGRSP